MSNSDLYRMGLRHQYQINTWNLKKIEKKNKILTETKFSLEDNLIELNKIIINILKEEIEEQEIEEQEIEEQEIEEQEIKIIEEVTNNIKNLLNLLDK